MGKGERNSIPAQAAAPSSDQSHLSSALPEMLLSAFSPRHFISIVALSCFILSRFSLLLFTWFDRVLASGSKTVTLMAAWQEVDQAEVSVGVPVSSSSDQTSLKRETEPDLIRAFLLKGVRQVDTMSAQ